MILATQWPHVMPSMTRRVPDALDPPATPPPPSSINLALLPVPSTASISFAADAVPTTVADPGGPRTTSALCTLSRPSSTALILATQWPHVMPSMARRTVRISPTTPTTPTSPLSIGAGLAVSFLGLGAVQQPLGLQLGRRSLRCVSLVWRVSSPPAKPLFLLNLSFDLSQMAKTPPDRRAAARELISAVRRGTFHAFWALVGEVARGPRRNFARPWVGCPTALPREESAGLAQ